jgi:UDP-N-acetylglucosamine--N-acetylmuramyl-(pentapeptide) pyrophosphoryl-undecaprenol N-acetylglucosamine transferase
VGEESRSRETTGPRLALAGGGTGGHVVPGLHVLEHLVGAGPPPADVLWFGAGRPIEDRVLAGLDVLLAGVPHERVALSLEPPGGGAPSRVRLALRTLPSALRARRALRAHRSAVLVGLGGYTTLPAVLAARSLGLPVVLLEINAVAGRATRSLAPLATRVLHAWPSTVPPAPGTRHVLAGPPLAPAFRSGAPTEEEGRAARAALGLAPDRPLLLILGGSQGAAPLNRFGREHAARLVGAGLQVLHQTGPGRASEGVGPDASPGAGLRVVEYLDDVPAALAAATLVLSRGGASTLAEVAARGRPACVVPYPHHADRHQERNARLLGAGVRCVEEAALDGALAEELLRLAGPAGARERAEMTAALARAVPLDGSERLCATLLELAR